MVPQGLTKWYQSHDPNLVMCGRSPRVDGVVLGAGRRYMCSERRRCKRKGALCL